MEYRLFTIVRYNYEDYNKFWGSFGTSFGDHFPESVIFGDRLGVFLGIVFPKMLVLGIIIIWYRLWGSFYPKTLVLGIIFLQNVSFGDHMVLVMGIIYQKTLVLGIIFLQNGSFGDRS